MHVQSELMCVQSELCADFEVFYIMTKSFGFIVYPNCCSKHVILWCIVVRLGQVVRRLVRVTNNLATRPSCDDPGQNRARLLLG